MYCYLIYTSVGRIYSGASALYYTYKRCMYCLVVPFYWYANSILLRSQAVTIVFRQLQQYFLTVRFFFLDIKRGPGTPPPPGPGTPPPWTRPCQLLLIRTLGYNYTTIFLGSRWVWINGLLPCEQSSILHACCLFQDSGWSFRQMRW